MVSLRLSDPRIIGDMLLVQLLEREGEPLFRARISVLLVDGDGVLIPRAQVVEMLRQEARLAYRRQRVANYPNPTIPSEITFDE